jgi:hypothetical protein
MAFNLKFPLTVKPGPGRRARAPGPLQAGAAPYAFIFAEAQDFSQLNPCGETLCETLRLASLSAYHDSDDMLSDSLWLPVAAGGRSVAGRSHSSAMSALIAEHTHQPLISHERTQVQGRCQGPEQAERCTRTVSESATGLEGGQPASESRFAAPGLSP